MVFGENTIKPDQRVKEVLLKEFGLKKLNNIYVILIAHQIAEICSLSPLEIDQIFVNYGSGYYLKTTGKKKKD